MTIAPAPARLVADQDTVRAHNLRAVAEFVRSRGEVSRRSIGEALGLNKATVSSLVTELVGRGLLDSSGRGDAQRPGRPSAVLRIDGTTHASVVAEILADSVRVQAWSLALEHLHERAVHIRPADVGAEVTLRRLADAVVAMVSQLRMAGRTITGVMIAVPGLLDVSTGTVVASEPLGWEQVRPLPVLRRRSSLGDLPIEIGRIASLATTAESRQLPDRADLICLHGGEAGIGAGAVVDGNLLTGSRGRAGEVLFPLHRAVTGRSSAPALAGDLGLAALLRSAAVEPATLENLVGQVARRQRRATGALAQLVDAVGARLATLVALLDPTTVVLAGYLAPLTEHVRPALTTALNLYLHPRPTGEIEIMAGTYGPEAAQVGGAVLLADRAFRRLGRTMPR